jgi:hypothetical protein
MLDNSYKDTPLYKYLLTLKNSPRTDLSKGLIQNGDAIVLLFHLVPQFGFKLLADFSQDWRGSATIAQNYFGGNQNGFTGVDFSSGRLYDRWSNEVPKGRKPYWYRQGGRPYTNALTSDGFTRQAFLLKQLQQLGVIHT